MLPGQLPVDEDPALLVHRPEMEEDTARASPPEALRQGKGPVVPQLVLRPHLPSHPGEEALGGEGTTISPSQPSGALPAGQMAYRQRPFKFT